MKSRSLQLAAGLLLSTVPFTVLSCKKSETATSPGGASADKPAAETSAPAGAAALDVSAWGFAAKLPKNTEGFMAFYNTRSLVEGLLNSNWFKKVKANKSFGAQIEAGLSQLEADPQAKDVIALVKELAGKEIVFVLSEGASAQFSQMFGPAVWSSFFSGVTAGYSKVMSEARSKAASIESETAALEAKAAALRSGGTIPESQPAPAQPAPALTQTPELSRSAQLKLMEFAAEMEAPPLLLALNAVSAKAKVNNLISQALASLPAEVRAVVEEGTFTAGDGIEFKSLTFRTAKIPVKPGAAEAELKELTELLGSEKKATELIAKMKSKTVVAAWGWVGDYLVLSLGKDHSHVKFATGGDSVMSLKEVSPRAASWQARKPFAFGYLSQTATRTLSGGSLLSSLASLLELAAGQSPIPVAPVVADLKKLAARSQEIWPNDADALTTAAWWDGGVQAESFGGPKPRAFDSSKPLTFPALAGPATVVTAASRVNEAESDKTFAFVEDVSATLWESYQKNIKPGLPQEMAAQTGMAEALGIPMVKSMWKGIQDFRGSLGSESVFLVNLDGAMPALPNVPPNMKNMKIPRILFASELKDPAKLSASWKGFGDLIGSIIALSQAPITPKPTEKKDGDLTSWGWDLPMDLGDIWPHAAVSGNRWFFGTSTSLTKAAAGTAPTASGPAAGASLRVNFTPLWKYASALLPLSPTNTPEAIEAAEGVLGLMQAVSELTATTGESDGMAHGKLHFVIKDTP